MRSNPNGHSAHPRAARAHTARLAEAALADHNDFGDSFMAAWTIDELDRDADLDSVRAAWDRSEERYA